MSNQYLSFDVTKQSAPQQLITGRQGDSQLKFVTMLFWDGDKNIPYDLTGKQVAFEALKPDNTHIVDYEGITILDAPHGLVRYSFNEQVFAAAGTMQQAFFKITHTDSDNNVIADSTLEVAINILENRVEFGINSKDYLSEYDDLVTAVKKKFDDYAATVKDSIDKANAVHDQIVSYTELINEYAVITKKDFGEITNLRQPLGTTAVDRINNEFAERELNVKWYGALGDGTSDDTSAFKSAIDEAKSSGNGIFVPSGKYVLNDSLNLDQISLRGQSRINTTLKFNDGLKYGLAIDSYVRLSDIRVDTTSTTNEFSAIRIGSIYTDGDKAQRTKDGVFSTIDRIIIECKEGNSNVNGILLEPFGITDGNQHAWGIDVNNIFMLFPNNGIVLNTRDYGWINGNSFKNINIRGLNHFGVWLNSNGNNPRGIQHNVFDNIQVEYRKSTPNTARVLMVQAGEYNDFGKLTSFNDSGVYIPSVEYNVSTGYPLQTSIHDNDITSGTVEGQLIIIGSLYRLNQINLVVVDDWANKLANQSQLFRTKYLSRTTNVLGNNIFNEYFNDSDQVPMATQHPEGVNEEVSVDDGGANIGIQLNKTDQFRLFYAVFKDALFNLKSTGQITLAMLFKYDGDIKDLNVVLYANLFKGTVGTPYNASQFNFEKFGDGFYSAMFNINISGGLQDKENMPDFINITADISGTGKFKAYGIKATPSYVMHYHDIIDTHQISSKFIPVSTNNPSLFRELGVFMPPAKNLSYDQNLAIVKNGTRGTKVLYPVMF